MLVDCRELCCSCAMVVLSHLGYVCMRGGLMVPRSFGGIGGSRSVELTDFASVIGTRVFVS